MEQFQVDFRRDFFSGTHSNTFGFAGKGEISVDHTIVVRGIRRRPFWFSTDTEVRFDLLRVVNVQRAGKAVRFDVLPAPDSKKPGYFTVTAADKTAAEKIAQLLPTTRTEEFEQQQRDLGDFNELLTRATPRAFVTPSLVVINVIVFAAMVTAGVGFMQPEGKMVVPWGSNFGPLTTDGQWWRLFTSTFLHFGIVHLALNMWALYDTGRVVERLYGNAHFLLLYVASGLAGSIASLLWNPLVNSAGASGAIFGVYGGLLAFMFDPRNRVPASVMKAHRISAIVFLFYSLSYGMTHEGIDNAAHIGGLAGGLVMGALLARPLDAGARSASGLRRFGIALVAAPVALALLTIPIKNTGEVYRKDEQYLADLKWLEEEEKILTVKLTQWQELARSGSHPPAYVSQWLNREVIAPLRAIDDRLTNNTLDERSRLRPHQALVLESITSRRDGFRLVAEGINSDDRKKFEQAKSHFAASKEAIEKLKQLNAKK